jgi:hypothetical protein
MLTLPRGRSWSDRCMYQEEQEKGQEVEEASPNNPPCPTAAVMRLMMAMKIVMGPLTFCGFQADV